MRLSLAVPVLAGCLLGWTALAQAAEAPPPAAPIFYCPTPAKAEVAPAATPARSTGHAGHAIHTSGNRRVGCPTMRVAAERHRRHGHGAPPKVVASNDVSASQAFIYRYERALHGLDARAADEAWAEGRRRPCPSQRDHCPRGGTHDGGMHDAMHDGDAATHHAPPPEGPALAQRETPPPPCPHVCPGPEASRHGGPPVRREYDIYVDGARDAAEHAPAPQVEPLPPPPDAPPPTAHGYAWQDGHSGYRYDERGASSERAGGWSYSEVDGHGRYRHWGDRFGDEPDARWDDRHAARQWDGDHWAEGPHRCPPPVPASACTAGQSDPPRHADVAVAGRDAAGYLTWPGKTE